MQHPPLDSNLHISQDKLGYAATTTLKSSQLQTEQLPKDALPRKRIGG